LIGEQASCLRTRPACACLVLTTPEGQSINRIVVRGPNWVGDAVMTIPALRSLRCLFPNAHLTLVSKSSAMDIFIDADFVDQVLVYDRAGLRSMWAQTREWRRRKFDLAILFQNAFEAAAMAFLARVPIRVGYDTERRGFLLTHPVASPSWKDERHEMFYYLNIVGEVEELFSGRPSVAIEEPQFALAVSASRQAEAFTLLRQHGSRGEGPLVILCPGSINSRAKRWPAERYAQLADRLIENGFAVALIGSPGEVDVSEQVLHNMRRQPIVLTGETTVAEAAAIISIADLLITNDTGPAHIGAAVSTPTLVIFGPTNPLTTRPFGAAGEIIREPPDCAPCMLRNCPIDHRCMTAITPEAVFERASALLSNRLKAGLRTESIA